ncbi:hypothetical protein BJ138DRAFT_1143420, partial [Hygrophoropsis aurantiaca]
MSSKGRKHHLDGWKERRCNFYDDDGRERLRRNGEKGCYNNYRDCKFAHPCESEWDNAIHSLPPPSSVVADRDSEFYYTSASSSRRQTRKASSSSIHKSRRRDSFGSLSPRPRREDWATSSRRSRSPASSIISDQLERLRRDNQSRSRQTRGGSFSTRRSPVPEVHSRATSKERPPLTSDKASSAMPSYPDMPPPPPPLPLQQPPQPHKPPPPLPPLPSVASSVKTKTALGPQEKHALWDRRTDLLSTSMVARVAYAKSERDFNAMKRMVKSPPTEDTPHITAQLAALELQREKGKKERNDAIERLVETMFWPAFKQPDVQSVETKYENMTKQLTELQARITELSVGYLTLTGKFQTTNTPGLSDPSTMQHNVPDKADIPVENTEGMILCSRADLDAMHDKLQGLTHHVSIIQNYYTQRDGDMYNYVEERIDEKIGEIDFDTFREDAKITAVEIEAVVAPILAERLSPIDPIEQELQALARKHTELKLQKDAVTLEAALLKREEAAIRERLAKDEKPDIREAIAKSKKELDAVNTVVQVLASRAPPASQPVPIVPSAEYFLEELENPITNSVRAQCASLLIQLRDELLSATSEENTKLFNLLSPKLVTLSRFFDIFTTQVLRPEAIVTNQPPQGV